MLTFTNQLGTPIAVNPDSVELIEFREGGTWITFRSRARVAVTEEYDAVLQALTLRTAMAMGQ